ncbi:MAG: hypothetical protein KKA16_12265 [Alphaproteobacteria bacterium]|nr:hypothetical protein [Alphaproteobacteria bacterium]MBU2379031.1 hypothetical protein [Alphaproteobacteria bacterium]
MRRELLASVCLVAATLSAEVRAQTPRAASPETRAAQAGGGAAYDAFVASLDRDVAACEAAPARPGDCYDLLMEAAGIVRGRTRQWGGTALTAEGAATTEAYSRRAVAVARSAFANTQPSAWGPGLDAPDYRIPNAEHRLAVHLLRPIVDRPRDVAGRAAEAEGLMRTAYAAAAVHDRASDRADLWNMDWLEHLALALSLQGRQAEAIEILHERVAQAERTWGPDHGRLYQYLPALAQGQLAGGDAVAAVATWRRAIALARTDGGVDRREMRNMESALARAQAVGGDSEGALATYQALLEEIGTDALYLPVDGLVLGYAGALQALGRHAEAFAFLGRQMQVATNLNDSMAVRIDLGLSATASLMQMDRSGDAAQLLGLIAPVVEQTAGIDSPMALRVRSLLAVAQARNDDIQGVQSRIDGLLPEWRQAAAGNPALYSSAMAAFGEMRVQAGRAGEGRLLLMQAYPLELDRWCPSHRDRGAWIGDRSDSTRDQACPGHPALTSVAAMLASANLRDGGRAAAAARRYGQASDMVLGRTRLRYRLSVDARREYGRFRGVHQGFVSTAWASTDPATAATLAGRSRVDDDGLLTVAETLSALPSIPSNADLHAIPIS